MKVNELLHKTISTPTPILWGRGCRRVFKCLLGWDKVHPPQPAALSIPKLCPGQGPLLLAVTACFILSALPASWEDARSLLFSVVLLLDSQATPDLPQ